jgi:hypothetical protein
MHVGTSWDVAEKAAASRVDWNGCDSVLFVESPPRIGVGAGQVV